MSNLINVTVSELKTTIKGIQADYELNNKVDSQYQLEFKITENDERSFTVKYDWYKGEIPGENGDPRITRDTKYIPEKNQFIISKSESFRKLAKEVFDALDEVTAHEYEEDYEETLP